MSSIKIANRFKTGDFESVKVEKLIWIATALETVDLGEILLDIWKKNGWNNLFKAEAPKLSNNNNSCDKRILIDWIISNDIYGFLAILHIPRCTNFQYRKGDNDPWKWKTEKRQWYKCYIYSENLDDLINYTEYAVKKSISFDVHREVKGINN